MVIKLKIDKSLPIPLYEQVKKYLEQKIISGEWEVGYKIPTEQELTKGFEVSNITVKRAVHELVNEGLLIRQSGKGTFVTRKEVQNFNKFVTLRNEDWENRQHPHRVIEFSVMENSREIQEKLEIERDEKVYQIKRIKENEKGPIAIEYSYIPCTLVPNLTAEDIEDELLYNIFEKDYHIKLKKSKVFFSFALANEHEASLLNISPDDQITIIERYTLTIKEEIIEYSKFLLKETESKFYVEIDLE